jgi:hypothetical protein
MRTMTSAAAARRRAVVGGIAATFISACAPSVSLGSDVAATDTTETDEATPTTPCLACAQAQCGDELDLCERQETCACFLECLLAESPPDACQASCMPTSGVAAVVVCVQTSCGQACADIGSTS